MIPDTFWDFSHRLRVVLKHFSGFFPVAEFLHALSLQMALLGLLEDLVGSTVPLAKELGSLFPTFVEHHGWRSTQRNRGGEGKGEAINPGLLWKNDAAARFPSKLAGSLPHPPGKRAGLFPFAKSPPGPSRTPLYVTCSDGSQTLPALGSIFGFPRTIFRARHERNQTMPRRFTSQNKDIPRVPLSPGRRREQSCGSRRPREAKVATDPFALRAERKAEKLLWGEKKWSGSGETENLWPKSSATRQVPWTWKLPAGRPWEKGFRTP